MKSIKPLAYALFGIATLAATLSSCQDEEFGYTAEQIAYESNFRKAFGNLSNIPTFDLSTYNLNRLGLEGGPSNDYRTRASGSDVFTVDNNWFYVPAGIEQWLTTKLKESQDNRKEGTKDFTLSMPSNDVLLIPVYQGQAGMTWDLYVTDGQIDNTTGVVSNANTNQKIWSKSEGIQVKKAGTGTSGIN